MLDHCILNRLSRVDVVKLPLTVSDKGKLNLERIILVLNHSEENVPQLDELLFGSFLPIAGCLT